jgi:multimeric flavodoxin WrbA
MKDLLDQMFDSEVWILGTPVYWWGPTAQFKAFLDRWYGVNDRSKFRGRQVVLVIPSGGTGEYSYGPTKDMLERVLNYLGMTHVRTILGPGLGKRGAVESHPNILEPARQIGRNIAQEN